MGGRCLGQRVVAGEEVGGMGGPLRGYLEVPDKTRHGQLHAPRAEQEAIDLAAYGAIGGQLADESSQEVEIEPQGHCGSPVDLAI